MTILHLTDFHFNQRWFDWLLRRAPAHDLTVMSGDLLDLASATPPGEQIRWASNWLNRYPRPLCVASGNHDLEWHERSERWMPAYWLRFLANPSLWVDGQRVELNGTSILNIGCVTRPKGGSADVWVVHAAPANTRVATRASGGDGGDPDLNAPVARFAPRLVLSGHVHEPLCWRQHDGATLLLNPGRAARAEVPNHILVNTDNLSCRFFGTLRDDAGKSAATADSPHDVEDTTAAAVA